LSDRSTLLAMGVVIVALIVQLVLCASAETPSATSAETPSANCLGSQGAHKAQLSASQHEPKFQFGDDVTLLQQRGLDKSLEKDDKKSNKDGKIGKQLVESSKEYAEEEAAEALEEATVSKEELATNKATNVTTTMTTTKLEDLEHNCTAYKIYNIRFVPQPHKGKFSFDDTENTVTKYALPKNFLEDEERFADQAAKKIIEGSLDFVVQWKFFDSVYTEHATPKRLLKEMVNGSSMRWATWRMYKKPRGGEYTPWMKNKITKGDKLRSVVDFDSPGNPPVFLQDASSVTYMYICSPCGAYGGPGFNVLNWQVKKRVDVEVEFE